MESQIVKEVYELDEMLLKIITEYKNSRDQCNNLKEKVNKIEDSDEKFKARGNIERLDLQVTRLFEDFKSKILVLKNAIEYEVKKEGIHIHFPYYNLSNKHRDELRSFLKSNFDCKLDRGNKTYLLYQERESDEAWGEEGEIKTGKKKKGEFKSHPDNVTKIWLKNYEKKSNLFEIWVKTPFCYNSPLVLYKVKVTKFSKKGNQITKSHLYDKVPSKVEEDVHKEGEIQKIHLNIDLAKVHHFHLDIKAVNKEGPSHQFQKFKIIVPKLYNECFIMGDTSHGQIEETLIPEKLKKEFFQNEYSQEKKTYMKIPIKITLENLTKEIEVKQIVSKNSTLAILNNWSLVQWGLTVVKDDKNEFNLGPSGLFTPHSMAHNPILFSRISVTLNSCVAVSSLGQVYTWGSNEYGQLGHNDQLPRAQPTLVDELKNMTTFEISCGHFHAMSLTDKGKVYNWGFRCAQTGVPIKNRYEDVVGFDSVGDNHQKYPQEISKGYIYEDDPAVKVEAGANNSAILTKSGKLFIWGDNSYFQVGGKEFSFPVAPIIQQDARKLALRDVSLGEEHVLILDFKGVVWVKGNCEKGCAGSLVEEDDFEEFTQIEADLGHIVKIYAGDGVSYLVDKHGVVFCSGRRLNGIKGEIVSGWWKLNFNARDLYVGINNLSIMV